MESIEEVYTDMIHTIISQILTLLFLAAAAFCDRRSLSVPIILPASVFCVGFAVNMAAGQQRWWQILLGCIPGVVIILISLASSGAIGIGDGLVLAAAGPCLGLVNTLFLLTVSLICASAGACVLVAMHKIKVKDRLAFLPFVLGGYIFMLFVTAL